MRRRLPAILLFFATSFASAAPTPWTEVRSPHFIVYTNAGEHDGRRVAGQFERMRSVFHTLLPGAASDNEPPITVLALKDKKSFQSIEPESYLAKGALDLAGMFLRTPDKNYILMRLDNQGEHPFSTVYHEYTHYMLRKADSFLPLWLNEGLAQFYENTEIENKEVRLGQASVNEILYLREQHLLPLATLLAVDHNSPYYHEEQKGSAFYAESWALTHYLIVNDRKNNTHMLTQYMHLVQNYEDPVVAAQHAFGDLKKLEQSLNGYISGATFSEFRMNSGFALDDSALQARPASQSEADTVRADVLVSTRRTQEAETLIEAVLRDDPKSAAAHEVMGNLRLRVNDPDGAQKWYGEAVQLGSQNYMVQFQYAMLSLRGGGHDRDAAVEASLREAIKLNPTFAPPYDSLAMFYMSRGRDLGEAHRLTVRAIENDPANMHYRMNAAAVLQQDQQPDNAVNVLKTALKIAHGAGEKTMLQGRIDSIERYKAMGETPDRALTASISERPGPVIAVESEQVTVAPAQGQSEAEARNAARITGLHNSLTESHPAHTQVELSADGKTATVDLNAEPEPANAKGVLRDVHCAGPGLTLNLEETGRNVKLFSSDLSKIAFTSASHAAIDPCKNFEGAKASVVYTPSEDANSASQIVSIELTQ
ncbi:Tetratricopeptide repeat-containing protein [Granulicella rosea]|uniref:Tetratricopeptide repeat-containing protein n=1 Tax=Granulicella rosea TaxID=474952 RepID=A0A239IU57_9BACT|nr:DUF1570 domain-containing protein [Granulicella rosea]SNS96922.1 Tetratricopeptide repeat-containing protein [Granulicella rosea]